MPKKIEPLSTLRKPVQSGSDFTVAWPKLNFSPATGETNISSFVKNLEEAIAANFGVHYATLMRTGKPWIPPIPKYKTVKATDHHYLFYKDLRKSMISNYAAELFKAENINLKLYGIIWASLSKESKHAIGRLPEWAGPGDPIEEEEIIEVIPIAPKSNKKKKSAAAKSKGSRSKKAGARAADIDDDPPNDDMGDAPNQPRDEIHDPTYLSIFALSSTRLHTLEELWRAILRTHIIEPSGPRKASVDVFNAMEQYHDTKMGPKESLSNFKERFIFALARVRIVGGVTETEDVGTTRFIKALDPGRFNDFWRDLDTSITMGGRDTPSTLDEAFRLAYDSLIKVNSTFKYSAVNETSTLLTTTQPKEKDKPKGYKGSKPSTHPWQKKNNHDDKKKYNHNDKKKETKSKDDGPNTSKDYACYFCNRKGHVQKDCYGYKAARAFSTARSASNSNASDDDEDPPAKEDKKVDFNIKRKDQERGTGRTQSYTTWRVPKFPDSDDERSAVLMVDEERSHLHAGYVILDDASGTNIIKDRNLLTNLRRAPKPMIISGIANGPSITSNEIGDLPYFGECYFHAKASANVLCQTRIEDLYPIDYKQGKYFKIHVNANTIVEFNRDGARYTCPNTFFIAHKGSVVDRSSTLISSQSPQPYSKRVQETLKVQRNLAYPALSSLRRFVTRGSMLNMPITGKHVDETIAATNGKTTEELKGKAQPNKEAISHTERISTTTTAVTLHIDVMFIMSIAFLLTVSEPIGYAALAYLTKRSWKVLGTELVRIINGYKGKGHTVTRIRSDNEGCIVASKGVLEGMGIDVDLCDPESNVHKVESKIRWIKERARTILFSIRYPPPDITIPWLPRFVVHCINIVQHSRTGLIPREQLTGIRVDYKRDARLCWGDIVEVFKSPQILNSMQTRSVTCIALAPAGNTEGSWHFLSLNTGAIIKGYRWKERNFDELAMQAIKMLNAKTKESGQLKKADGAKEDESQDQNQDYINETIPENHQNSENSENPKIIISEPEQEILHDKTIPTSVSDLPINLQAKPWADDGETIPRDNLDSADFRPIPNTEIFGTPNIPENRENDFSSQLMESQRPISLLDNSESDFENVGSNFRSNVFCTESHTTSWCFNISVSEAAKRYPVESKLAMQNEFKQMITKKVFHPIFVSDIPKSSPHSIIYSSMFLKEKFDLDGALKKLKARLVGGGNMQDRDLYERSSISSPTVAVAAVLIIIAIAAALNHVVYTIDIAGAYLNADIGESNIYMTLDSVMTKLYIELHPEAKKFVMKNVRMMVKLDQTLYGFLWFDIIKEALLEYGFTQNRKDPCVFNLFSLTLTVCLYVDDLLITCPSNTVILKFISFLRDRYKELTVNDGRLHTYLGMNFEFRTGRVRVSMDSHVADMVNTFVSSFGGDMPTRVISSPSTADLFTSPKDGDSPLLGGADKDSFHTIVAKGLFIAKRVRPDILAPISFLSGRVQDPTISDQIKLRRMIHYLHQTNTAGIVLDVHDGRRPDITAWVDSSFGTHLNGAGQTGYVISLGGGPIMASSCKQKHVTTSSGECELAGLYESSTGVVWTRDFILEQGFKMGPARILHDNTSAITLAEKGFSSSKRSRHFHIKHLFIADRIKDGEFMLEHCEGKKMRADILTKGISGGLFTGLAKEMMNDDDT